MLGNPNSAMGENLRISRDLLASRFPHSRLDGRPRDGSPRSDGANTDNSAEGQMPTIPVPAVHFSSADKELLDSGKYADAKIIANGKIYAVHKSVLFTRSKWFRRALEGDFREGQEGVIKISAPDNIGRVLEFLYTGAVDLRDDADLMIAANELSVLGDFYLVEEMKQYASQVLAQYLGQFLNTLCEVRGQRTMPAEYATSQYWSFTDNEGMAAPARGSTNYKSLLKEGFISRLSGAIRDAYAKPSGIQLVYIDFVCAARLHTFGCQLIQILRDNIPDFGNDMLGALLNTTRPSAFQGNETFEKWKGSLANPAAATTLQADAAARRERRERLIDDRLGPGSYVSFRQGSYLA